MALNTMKEVIIGMIVLAVLLIIAGHALLSVEGLRLGRQLDAKKIEVKGDFSCNNENAAAEIHVKDLKIFYTGEKPVNFYPVFRFGEKFSADMFEPKTSERKYLKKIKDSKIVLDEGVEPDNFIIVFSESCRFNTLTIFFYRAPCEDEFGYVPPLKDLQKCARNFISSDSILLKDYKRETEKVTGQTVNCHIIEPANRIFHKISTHQIVIECNKKIISKTIITATVAVNGEHYMFKLDNNQKRFTITAEQESIDYKSIKDLPNDNNVQVFLSWFSDSKKSDGSYKNIESNIMDFEIR